MASLFTAGLCALIATAFWALLGYALARHLMPRALAIGAAMVTGWAVHSALALPLYRLIGFSPLTVVLVSLVFLACALLALCLPASADNDATGTRVPPWAYALAALLAVVPAVAVFPKFYGDAVALAGPIFDHSKVAIIDEMTRLGLPPGNPFFGEAGHHQGLAYYYLWHFSAAELALLPGVAGWEADISLSALTAFSSLALMMGFAVWIGRLRRGARVVPLAFAASLWTTLELFLAPIVWHRCFAAERLCRLAVPDRWAPQHLMAAGCR